MLKKNIITFFFTLFVLTPLWSTSQNIKLKTYCIRESTDSFFINKKYIFPKNLDSISFEKINKKILLKYSSLGYPFCRIKNDSIIENSNNYQIFSTLDLNKKFFIKNIYFIGKNKISKHFIYNLISIAPKDFYNEKKVSNIFNVLSTENLIKVIKMPEKEFFSSYADLYLYFNTIKTNNINALAMLCYDQTDHKYYLKGQAGITLKNNFSHAEEINFSWFGFNKQSQQLDLEINLPFIFKTKTSFATNANLTKTGSKDLNIRFSPKILIKHGLYFYSGFLADFRRITTSNLELSNDFLSAKTFLLGIENIFKQKNICITNSFSTGNREKETISELCLTIKGKQNIFEGKIFLNYLFQAKNLISNQNLYYYEKYPLGGPGQLRGFNKNQFYAQRYVLINSELVYELSDLFSILVFNDICKIDQLYSGLGPGIRITKGQSEINFNYALEIFDKKIQPLKYAKAHIFIILKF